MLKMLFHWFARRGKSVIFLITENEVSNFLFYCFRPGSVQTSVQQAFVSTFHDAYHHQICVYPPNNNLENLKPLADSMDDELLSPPLHVVTSTEDHSLLTREHLPNAVRLSTLILKHLSPHLGKVGLSLALARLTLMNVSIDRSVSLNTIVRSSLDGSSSRNVMDTPVKGFIKDNKVLPDSTGAFVFEAPDAFIKTYKTYANSGKWKKWFSLPSVDAEEPIESTESIPAPGQLNDEDYDDQYIDIQKLLISFVPEEQRCPEVSSPVHPKTPTRLDTDASIDELPPAAPELVTFLACHGSLLFDWFDSRSDAMFTAPLLEALRGLRMGDYGPYYFTRRGDIPAALTHDIKPPRSSNELDASSRDIQWDEDGHFASILDVALRLHLSK